MPRFDFGLYPTTGAAESVRLARLAEALGFGTVWVTDSPVIWRELWVTLTAIGVATTRVRLGSAVTSGVIRHPAVTAGAAMTLSELTDGRLRLGLGNGDSALVTTGGRPQSLAAFRSTVAILRTLLARERAEPSPGVGIRLEWAGRQAIPLYVAASGPRMLELAGELADGVIMMVGVSEPMVRAAIDRVRAGAARARRNPDSIDLVLWTSCAVSDRSPADAVGAVKATVARTVLRTLPLPIPGAHDGTVARIRAAYDYGFHSDPRAPHGQLVPDDLVSEFAVAGPSGACAEQLGRLAKLGLSGIALALPHAAFDDRGAMLARLAASVLPAV
ncbi:MAG: LLM class flavin-dependent oxidoreductase [Candidatus Rokuibacteriota bacterium]